VGFNLRDFFLKKYIKIFVDLIYFCIFDISNKAKHTNMKQVTYKETIESLMNEWEVIKDAKQWNKWADKVKATRFGTYGTIPFAEVFKNTGVEYKTTCGRMYFMQEIDRAYSGFISK
jgi:hypothetical protein